MPTSAPHGLYLIIDRGKKPKVYRVRRLYPHPAVPGPAWSLRQTDGTVYEVYLGEHGPVCECKDYDFRQRLCKHIEVLTQEMLL